MNVMEQINLNKNVTIEFTPQQIKLVLDVLKKQQYDIVSDVIDSIQSQIVKQIKENPLKATRVNGVTEQEITHE